VRRIIPVVGLLALVTTCLLPTTRANASPPQKSEPPQAQCAFSNAYNSGWCRVSVPLPAETSPRDACTVVLHCLNGDNVACAGNINPCHSDVRSGWRMEEARAGKPEPTPTR